MLLILPTPIIVQKAILVLVRNVLFVKGEVWTVLATLNPPAICWETPLLTQELSIDCYVQASLTLRWQQP